MSETTWISPVSILDSKILRVSFRVNEDAKLSRARCSLTMSASIDAPSVSEDRLVGKCVLSASGDWFSDDEHEAPAFVSSGEVGIVVAVDLEAVAELNDDEKAEYVSANALSLAYGKIRACIEMITAESPVGRQTLPAIDPYALLESLQGEDL